MYRILPLFLLGALLPLCFAAEGNSRFHSAKCLALGKECNEYLERQSGFCLQGTAPRKQSAGCYKLACQWCNLEEKKDLFPCTARVLVRSCKKKKKMKKMKKMPEMEPEPEPGMPPMKKKGKKKGKKKKMMEDPMMEEDPAMMEDPGMMEDPAMEETM